MRLPDWENRPEITGNLFNPAFCSIIIRECLKAYREEGRKQFFPFSLSYIILPLILNESIREYLPVRKSSNFQKWIYEYEELKINLVEQIESFVSFTREALMFGIIYSLLSIDNEGYLTIPEGKEIKTSFTHDKEIKDCISKAKILGKIFSKTDPDTIYSILSIKP